MAIPHVRLKSGGIMGSLAFKTEHLSPHWEVVFCQVSVSLTRCQPYSRKTVYLFTRQISFQFTGSVHTKVISDDHFWLILQQSDSTGKWEKTVLEIDTRERNRLPIMDVSAYDIGGKEQDFKLEIGPACFHHTVLTRTA